MNNRLKPDEKENIFSIIRQIGGLNRLSIKNKV